MTINIKDITPDNCREYSICYICSKIFNYNDMRFQRQIPSNLHCILGHCIKCNVKLEQQENDKQRLYSQRMNEDRLKNMKEYLASNNNECECETEVSDETCESDESNESEVSEETCESDESNESEVSENNNKDDIITCEKSQKMTTKENDKTITKKIKLEFWISL